MENEANKFTIINEKTIKNKIYIIRNQKVMLDSDLADIYGYTTKTLNQQVKNNNEKFEEDFRFQLTDSEYYEILRSKNLTSNKTNVKRGGRRYNPYVFTEQGIYMLMTVLKGELAISQSKALIRTFKELKDYLVENHYLDGNKDIIKLSLQTAENTRAIKSIEKRMATKKELIDVIKNFTSNCVKKEILILNGQMIEANIAYTDIYNSARVSIYIIDNYIGLKTLLMLKNISRDVKIIVFSDNVNHQLHKSEYEDFIKEYPNVNLIFKRTENTIHDRYIIIDYQTETEQLFHCGTSSKDAGKRITSITNVKDKKVYYPVIDSLLNKPSLFLQ